MARREADSDYESLWRRRLVVIAAVLFPLLVVGGVLAPQVVSVMIDESQLPGAEIEEDETPELHFDTPIPGMPPLPLPLEPMNVNTGFIPEQLDLQHLFTRNQIVDGPMSRRFSRLLSFPRNHGDVIVMDDVDREIRDVVFKDPILVGAITEDFGPTVPGLFTPDSPRPGDGLTFDDPQGRGEGDLDPGQLTAVPEPNGFGLVLAGLFVLACRGRRRELSR